ncbi:hypothetical protein DFH06DRAFT_1465928 [Mycena polygramma]|nr:hypothetical protein DFH06DRAFT_1465928 [Mycena polygramma]
MKERYMATRQALETAEDARKGAEEARKMAEAAAEIAVKAPRLRLQFRRTHRRLEMEQARNLESMTTPALALPSEITSEIFRHFLPVYPRCPPLFGSLSPTFLTHICRTWRDIALTTPTLWRAIPFYTDTAIVPFARRLEIFNLWLSRSSHYPLSIEIVIQYQDQGLECLVDEDPDGHSMTDNVSEVVTAAALHSARWEYLKLHVRTNVFPTIGTPMPLLRCLDLDLEDDCHAKDIGEFHSLPVLRTLILNLDDLAASTVDLPWAQLTSFTLTNALPEACSSLLQQTPHLVHCKLQLTQIYGNGHPVQPPDITLSRLESLTFLDDCDVPEAWYLDTLTLPALRNFRVPESFLWPNYIHALSSVISKSGSELQDICIVDRRVLSEDSYREAFPSIPKFSFLSSRPDYEGPRVNISPEPIFPVSWY